MGLFESAQPIVGDIARVHLLERVLEIAANEKLNLLDVGCGDGSLWKPLLGNDNIELWGVDRDGERVKAALAVFGEGKVKEGNIYDLSDLFAGLLFDVVVSTQVFSYVRNLRKGLREINKVTKIRGKLLFTIGLLKYHKSYRRLRRKLAGYLWEEHYYRYYDELELTELLNGAGFRVDDVRFHTVHPLKEIHDQIISPENKNRMLHKWKEMEDILISDPDFALKGKPYCLGLYMEATKHGEAE
ncbi:MAG: class I SAM-dependent methyltransferase [Anaerolineae bacterium]